MDSNRLSAPVKIADVARIAGVSVATVSRALANPSIVTPAARARVMKAVRETGYTPNAAARNLRVRKAMMVLVVVPDIANVFFAEVLRGIDQALSEAGYGFIIGNLSHAAEKDGRYVALAQSGQVDGVLLLCGHMLCQGERSLADASVPIVAACERICGSDVPYVEVNNRESAEDAVRHLILLGHRRIAYISGPSGCVLDDDRRAGYRAGLAAGGISHDPALELAGNFTFLSGAEAAETILAFPPETRPTAVFSANDEMAIACLKRLSQHGVRIPGDFSIIGFDAIDFADYSEPTLSTMRQPRRELGHLAGQMLIARMNGEEADPASIVLEAPLLARGSTGPCTKQAT